MEDTCWVMRAAEIGLAPAVIGLPAVPPSLPAWLSLVYVLSFVAAVDLPHIVDLFPSRHER